MDRSRKHCQRTPTHPNAQIHKGNIQMEPKPSTLKGSNTLNLLQRETNDAESAWTSTGRSTGSVPVHWTGGTGSTTHYKASVCVWFLHRVPVESSSSSSSSPGIHTVVPVSVCFGRTQNHMSALVLLWHRRCSHTNSGGSVRNDLTLNETRNKPQTCDGWFVFKPTSSDVGRLYDLKRHFRTEIEKKLSGV